MHLPDADRFSGNSLSWLEHFRANRCHMDHVPWDHGEAITPAERASIARSIATFQLGENSEGRAFLRAGRRYAARTGDRHYLSALQCFIEEEQSHSRVLGRFMDRQGIPRLDREWTDTVFRFIRKLAGLNVCITVLITAEIIAAVYYRALGQATRSPVLRAICGQILVDERYHLSFQAAALAKERRDWSRLRRSVFEQVHRLFLFGTLLVVWREHRSVYRSGGFGFMQMASGTWAILEEVLRSIRAALSDVGKLPCPQETITVRIPHLPAMGEKTVTGPSGGKALRCETAS